MPTVEATHWICGTKVSAEVPDDYDLEEGVALACTRCQDVWWHYPLARGAAGESGVDATIAGRRPHPGLPRSRDAPRLVTNWLGPALALCVLALVLLRLADLGPRSSAAPRSGAVQQADRPSPRPPRANAFTTVRTTHFTIARPAGWITFARNGATVLAPSVRAPISVAVYADRRPELSVSQMEGLVRQLLETQLPGARITGPAAARLGGVGGSRLTARRGAVLRETIIVAAGEYRYVIQVSARAGASGAQRARLNRIVGSFRAIP